MWNWKKRSKQEEKQIAGIGAYEYGKNNRVIDCVARAIMVFFITVGSMGIFLQAFEIPYRPLLVYASVLVAAFYAAFLFYNRITKNAGYLLLFVLIVAASFTMYIYVNSGFYAIVNIAYEKLQTLLQLEGVMAYSERITNRVLTINSCLVLLGCVFSVLLNVIISNYMSTFWVVLLTGWLAFIPAYFNLGIDGFYGAMLLIGYVAVYCLRRSRHYRYPKKKAQFQEKKKCTTAYYQNGAVMLQLMVFVLAGLAVIALVAGILFSGVSVQAPKAIRKYKEASDEYVKDFIALGFLGFFNQYESTGGLNGGRLGGVSSVRADGQTDITISYAPGSLDTVYLRGFIGQDYLKTYWSQAESTTGRSDANVSDEANQLKKLYEQDDSTYAKAKMEITNEDANDSYAYLPYYTEDDSVPAGGMAKDSTTEVTYYPYDSTELLMDTQIGDYEVGTVDNAYLYVPTDNWASIKRFCQAAQLSGSVGEIAEKMADYFQEEYPYTLRPGITPKGKDYVNYFLDESKKGLCANYATAATLIFRYMGIPARYVEGYALNYTSMAEGSIVEGENYEEWYDGYSSIGKTSVVSVEITDANAHAWVEVYVNGFGWVPVDVTPAATESDSQLSGFWQLFGSLGSGGGLLSEEGDADLETDALLSNTDDAIYGVIVLLSMIACGLLLLQLIKYARILSTFHTKSYENNIKNRYEYACRRLRKKDKTGTFARCITQEEQFAYFRKQGMLPDNITERMLEDLSQACYGFGKLDAQRYHALRNFIKHL